METQASRRQADNTISLLKFVFAILIVAFHTLPGEDGFFHYGIRVCWGRVTTPFFFMSSAFFLYRKTAVDQVDYQFIKRHLVKMIRFYITWSIIYFPLSLLEAVGEGKGLLHTGLKLVRDFLFYGSFTHLWYLHAAIVSVILVSGLLYLRINPKKIVIIALAFYFAGLLAQSWFGLIRPLEGTFVWDLLKLIKRVIVSTRDGLFLGFIFTGIGMLFAFYEIPMKRERAKAGFLLSMLLMLLESYILRRLGFIRKGEDDVYFFLVPAAFFLFAYIQRIELSDHKIYKTLRVFSVIIYFIHLWVAHLVCETLEMICAPLRETWVVFAITIIVTLAIAAAILKLSERPRLKWLKRVYS